MVMMLTLVRRCHFCTDSSGRQAQDERAGAVSPTEPADLLPAAQLLLMPFIMWDARI